LIQRNLGRSVVAWAVRLALVLVVATGCHSCSFLSGFGGIYAGHVGKAAGGSHYFGLRATKDGAGGQVQPSRELRKPFRLETTLGLPDPKHADLGTNGSFGVSVLEAGGLGRYFVVQVKRSGDGIVLEAGTGGAPLGTLTIPDSRIADIEIASNGGVIAFAGRKSGDAAFTPIAVATAPSAGPYVASLDVLDLPKGTVVGYFRARLTANALPAFPSPTQTARETIYTAIDAVAESMYAIDAEAPDRTFAGDQLALAVTRFDAALAMDLSGLSGAEKKVKSARKKAAALEAGVRGKKSVTSALKSFRAILTLAGESVNAHD
jgi:hypothetical protein